MTFRLPLLATFTFVAFSAASAHAGLITNIQDPALAGSTIIDFDNLPLQSFSSMSISGVTFTAAPGGYQLNIAPYTHGGVYGGSGNELSTVDSKLAFDIAFATSVSAFGMNWGGANLNWTVSLFDSTHSLIETLMFLGGDPGKGASYIEFYGAKASGIRYVSLVAEGADWVKIDDFHFVPQVASVPEPASLLLLSAGVVAIGITRRWQRRGGPSASAQTPAPSPLPRA